MLASGCLGGHLMSSYGIGETCGGGRLEEGSSGVVAVHAGDSFCRRGRSCTHPPRRSPNSFLIGSWGKDTVIRPPRDVDLYFVLPVAVYHRFQGYVWNRQSALLQEVKNVLSSTYPDTDMSGDGQVVLVRFESYSVEVVPAFLLTSGRYWICNTHDGGRYKETDPWAEVGHIDAVDQTTNNNLRPLIRMLKSWQY
jgi:Second Messenger Oligonucleotide or Dinucleotide Synthetase domain